MDQHHKPALWAASCGERVLILFEVENPEDIRPRQAIEAARQWQRGELAMKEARKSAFASHAAARQAKGPAAVAAARSAGHAAATAHVATHAHHAASYARKAKQAAEQDVETERNCRFERLPGALRRPRLGYSVHRAISDASTSPHRTRRPSARSWLTREIGSRPISILSYALLMGWLQKGQLSRSFTSSAVIRLRKPRALARLPQLSIEHHRLGFERLALRKKPPHGSPSQRPSLRSPGISLRLAIASAIRATGIKTTCSQYAPAAPFGDISKRGSASAEASSGSIKTSDSRRRVSIRSPLVRTLRPSRQALLSKIAAVCAASASFGKVGARSMSMPFSSSLNSPAGTAHSTKD